jgi:hypothetical protein
MAGRNPNQLETALVTISTTPLVVRHLQALVETGFYGKNYTEAAERLLAATLAAMVRSGDLMPAPRPPRKRP